MAEKQSKAGRFGKPVRITNNHREGYRRAGVGHAKGAVVHEPDSFTADQVEAFRADPHLSVEIVDAPKDGKAGDGKTG